MTMRWLSDLLEVGSIMLIPVGLAFSIVMWLEMFGVIDL